MLGFDVIGNTALLLLEDISRKFIVKSVDLITREERELLDLSDTFETVIQDFRLCSVLDPALVPSSFSNWRNWQRQVPNPDVLHDQSTQWNNFSSRISVQAIISNKRH